MRVWAPAWRAINWSIEIEFCRSTRMSAPVSQTSTVLCPTSKRLVGCDRPPKMVMSRRCGSKGSSERGRAMNGAVGVGEPVPFLKLETVARGKARRHCRRRRHRTAGPLARRIGPCGMASEPRQGQGQSGAPRRNVRRSSCHDGRGMDDSPFVTSTETLWTAIKLTKEGGRPFLRVSGSNFKHIYSI